MKLSIDDITLEVNENYIVNRCAKEEDADWDRCTYTWEHLYRRIYSQSEL